MNATPNTTPLIHKLESILVLSEDEKDVLRKLSGTIKTVGPRQDLVREGDRPHECCLVLEGFVYRYKLTHEGKRQIFSFHIPVDIPDLQSLHIHVMDHSLSPPSANRCGGVPGVDPQSGSARGLRADGPPLVRTLRAPQGRGSDER